MPVSSRRSRTAAAALALAGLAGTWMAGPSVSAPPEGEPRHHALSLIGEPKFGPDFTHFDWVNPDAPKGGTVRFNVEGTFDTLNPFNIKGVGASGLLTTYDTLMASSPDEPSAEYGLVAEWVSYPPDFSSATFGLRPEARFHDGQPITPDDVVFSLDALKKAHPHFEKYYKNVVKAEKTGEYEVTFTFDSTGNRELPHILGQLYVLPRHYWQGKDSKGEPRDLRKSTTDVPLASGPYRIKSFESGRSIVYERVTDYWAKDLPVMRGQFNFDELRYTYFKDRTGAFEEFKKGSADYWAENMAQAWATQFDFPAVQKGLVKKEAIPTAGVARMQAFAFNTRRKQFQDPRVRRAFNLAFNFEELNRSVLYDQYIRVGSYFDNSELKATGLPEGRELEILKEVEKDVPPEVFTTEWKNPVNGTREQMRANLAEAIRLMKEAGWEVRQEPVENPDCGFVCSMLKSVGLNSDKMGPVLRNAAGEPLTAEFLLASETFQKIVLPYMADLERIGVQASIRIVDPAQYEKREQSFDFDIIVDGFPQSLSPGNEQRDFWGSASADIEGSRNTIGIKNLAIDHIIDRIVFATDRADLVAATRALDRVLLWNHYVVPQWHYPFDRLATWDMFGRPGKLPSQTSAFLQVWWVDAEKQKALAAKRGN